MIIRTAGRWDVQGAQFCQHLFVDEIAWHHLSKCRLIDRSIAYEFERWDQLRSGTQGP